eukprot:XP_001707052.1 Hypothetical protein GL50803_31565 [Giardia lamblia ATCC 50803]
MRPSMLRLRVTCSRISAFSWSTSLECRRSRSSRRRRRRSLSSAARRQSSDARSEQRRLPPTVSRSPRRVYSLRRLTSKPGMVQRSRLLFHSSVDQTFQGPHDGCVGGVCFIPVEVLELLNSLCELWHATVEYSMNTGCLRPVVTV